MPEDICQSVTISQNLLGQMRGKDIEEHIFYTK